MTDDGWLVGQPVRCAQCAWQVAWRDYFATYQGKQFMAPASAVEAYLQGLPRCVTSRDRLLLIDALIHECHKGLKRGDEQLYTRPVAVNLIQGSMNEVIAFLENLPYGPGSGPEMEVRLATWRRRCLNQMPAELRREVEALVAAGQHQRAAARLAEIEAYRGELDLPPGDVPREMVKAVAREIKARQRTPAQTWVDAGRPVSRAKRDCHLCAFWSSGEPGSLARMWCVASMSWGTSWPCTIADRRRPIYPLA